MNIYQTAQKLVNEIKLHERRGANEMVKSYGRIWADTKQNLDEITTQIQAAKAAGQDVSPSWLYRQDRYLTMKRQAEDQLRQFALDADITVQDQQRYAIDAARVHAGRLMNDAADESDISVSSGFSKLNYGTVESIIGTTSNGSPLSNLLGDLPGMAGNAIQQSLVSAVTQGWGPAQTASMLRDQFGLGLNRALTISRTETLRAYRMGSLSAFQQNSDVVEKWQWQCAETANTCEICWAMDGQLFDTEDMMDTHPNCACTMVPVVDIAQAEQKPTGEDVFAELDPADQLAVLGPGKFDLYQNGDITLQDLVVHKTDPEWGGYRTSRPLKDLVDRPGIGRIEKTAAADWKDTTAMKWGTIPKVAQGQIVEQLDSLMERYPQMNNKIEGVGSATSLWGSKKRGNTMAMAKPLKEGKSLIGFVQAKFANGRDVFGDVTKRAFEQGWISTSESSHILTHEFGHTVDNALQNAGVKVIDLAREKLIPGFNPRDSASVKQWNALRKDLSGYASAGRVTIGTSQALMNRADKEVFAEAFAEWHNGGKNQSSLAKEVGKIIEANLRKIK